MSDCQFCAPSFKAQDDEGSMSEQTDTVERKLNSLVVVSPREPGEKVRRAAARILIACSGKVVGDQAKRVLKSHVPYSPSPTND